MSDRRNKKSKSGRSPDRSRSRSAHRKKSDKQKSKKSKKYKRSYSRSSSRSRSNSSKRSRSSSKSPSQRKGYGSRYDRKLEQYSPEKDSAPVIPAEDEYRPQQSDSNCLVLTDLSDDITQDELQDMLQDLAISLGTSPPDSIQMVAILKTAYVMFPSVASAKKILYSLKGKLVNDKVNISMEFYPTNLTGQGQRQSREQAQDVSLVQDWICDKCNYKNFAKRGRCNRCDNSRNLNCKAVFNSASYVKTSGPPGSGQYHGQGEKGEGPQSSSSLMVRGAVLQDTDETDLLDFFNQFAPVKDIRMVRNKQTGKYRDFAFIEFYSVEEAEGIMNRAQEMDFRISGQPITLAFSRTKRREDEGGQGGQEETTTSPYPGYQQNRKNKGPQSAATQNTYGQDMTAYLQNAAAMNALDPQTAAYYQNYYQQYYGQGAAGMQQYMQNYGQAYNYNQTAAAYGTQGYNAQNYAGYANYGYNTTGATQNYATNQASHQQQLQQLQQQLQPSTIQQAVPTQTPQTQAQNPPQTQTILPGLGGTSSINPAVTSEKKTSTEIVTEQPPVTTATAKTMEVESIAIVQENKGEEKGDQMILEEKKDEGKEENKITEEAPTEGGNPAPESGENAVVEEKKVEEKKVLSKAEIEKNKRKQIELEMKKWEREQQMKALFGNAQEEEQQQGPEQGKKAEGKTQEGDKFAPMQVQSKQKTSIFTNVESTKTELPKKEVVSYKVFLGDVPVCKLCKRKFNDEYSIKLHEKFSTIHKENLSKIAS